MVWPSLMRGRIARRYVSKLEHAFAALLGPTKDCAYSDIPSASRQFSQCAPREEIIASINQSQTMIPDCQRASGFFY